MVNVCLRQSLGELPHVRQREHVGDDVVAVGS
jgi:hypothetical protein